MREMNRKKTGAPYKYPNTFITFASIIYSFFRMPYRQLEGFIGRLSIYEPGLVAADYTILHKRISKQDLGIVIPENDAVVAVDSTVCSPECLDFIYSCPQITFVINHLIQSPSDSGTFPICIRPAALTRMRYQESADTTLYQVTHDI